MHFMIWFLASSFFLMLVKRSTRHCGFRPVVVVDAFFYYLVLAAVSFVKKERRIQSSSLCYEEWLLFDKTNRLIRGVWYDVFVQCERL